MRYHTSANGLLFKQIVKCRFGGSRGIFGFFLTPRGIPQAGIQGKPVAEIRPLRLGWFFSLAFRTASAAVMTAVFA